MNSNWGTANINTDWVTFTEEQVASNQMPHPVIFPDKQAKYAAYKEKMAKIKASKLAFHETKGDSPLPKHQFITSFDDGRERTFVMLKPDAFERGLVGEIMDLLDRRGLTLVACKLLTMTPDQCAKHYHHHQGKDFYPELERFMTGGPSMACVFEGPQACTTVRMLIGQKHPSQSPAGSIRGRYAMEFPRNLIHGSDHTQDAAREMSLYFTVEEIYDADHIAALKEADRKIQIEKNRIMDEKMKFGIKLGEEVFSPRLLREGDFIAESDDFVSEILSINKIKQSDGDYVTQLLCYLYGPEYFLGQKFEANYTEESWDTGTNFPVLVQRNNKSLEGFKLPPTKDAVSGRLKVFVKGEWRPRFTKKYNSLNGQFVEQLEGRVSVVGHPGLPHNFQFFDSRGLERTVAIKGSLAAPTVGDIKLIMAKLMHKEMLYADYAIILPMRCYYSGKLYATYSLDKQFAVLFGKE